MKQFLRLLNNDLKRLYEYGIVLFVSILTFVFAMAMAVFPEMDKSNIIYFNIFVLPVIVFSISMFISREENTILPLVMGSVKPIVVVFAKIISAIIVELIPIIAFIIIFRFTKFETDYFLLFLVYLLGVTLHIIIALALVIISRTSSALSISYLTYILVFSATAILYSNGLIPLSAQPFLLISPAFMSAVLVDNILAISVYSETWLILLSIILQFVFGFALVWFVIKPYFKTYILIQISKKTE